MRGRFANDATTEELVRHFAATTVSVDEWAPTYLVRPLSWAPILVPGSDGGAERSELTAARWRWPRPPGRGFGPPLFQARIDRILNTEWSGAFSAGRCLVPMRGYFEWRTSHGDHQPHFIQGVGLLAAAGITGIVDTDDGPERVFVIITRAASGPSSEIHGRMPAFVARDHWADWFSSAVTAHDHAAILAHLAETSDAVADTLLPHPVDRRVNSSATLDPYDPSLIAPVRR